MNTYSKYKNPAILTIMLGAFAALIILGAPVMNWLQYESQSGTFGKYDEPLLSFQAIQNPVNQLFVEQLIVTLPLAAIAFCAWRLYHGSWTKGLSMLQVITLIIMMFGTQLFAAENMHAMLTNGTIGFPEEWTITDMFYVHYALGQLAMLGMVYVAWRIVKSERINVFCRTGKWMRGPAVIIPDLAHDSMQEPEGETTTSMTTA